MPFIRQKPTVILLDVYDTLLDMESVEKKVNALLKSSKGYKLWFELFMQYCFVDNCIEQFNDFRSIAYATLQMTAEMLERDITENDTDRVMDLFKQLPIHPHVAEGLSALADEGYRLAALTNSPEKTVRERMSNTGLISYFELVLSAEHVGKYKPSLTVYQWALNQLGVTPAEALMVSTHGWDLAGAHNAQMQTCHLEQGAQMLYPLTPQPDYRCTQLLSLAELLRKKDEVDT